MSEEKKGNAVSEENVARARKRRLDREFKKYGVETEEDLVKVKRAMEEAKVKAQKEAQERKEQKLLTTPYSKLSGADKFARVTLEIDKFREEMINKYLEQDKELKDLRKLLYMVSSIVGDVSDKVDYAIDKLIGSNEVEMADFEEKMEESRDKRKKMTRKRTESIELGDQVWVAYTGRMLDDGSSDPNLNLDEEQAKRVPPVVVGSRQHLYQFEDQLIGLKEGHKGVIKITFPKDYNITENGKVHKFAGRDAEFNIHILKVKYTEEAKKNRDAIKKRLAEVNGKIKDKRGDTNNETK